MAEEEKGLVRPTTTDCSAASPLITAFGGLPKPLADSLLVRRISLRPPPIGYPAFVVLLVPAAFLRRRLLQHRALLGRALSGPLERAGRLTQAANGVGKIAGPLCLALIAGTSNLITPKATIEAVTPAFLFLAACRACDRARLHPIRRRNPRSAACAGGRWAGNIVAIR
jgi:hypothetical protein